MPLACCPVWLQSQGPDAGIVSNVATVSGGSGSGTLLPRVAVDLGGSGSGMLLSSDACSFRLRVVATGVDDDSSNSSTPRHADNAPEGSILGAMAMISVQ